MVHHDTMMTIFLVDFLFRVLKSHTHAMNNSFFSRCRFPDHTPITTTTRKIGNNIRIVSMRSRCWTAEMRFHSFHQRFFSLCCCYGDDPNVDLNFRFNFFSNPNFLFSWSGHPISLPPILNFSFRLVVGWFLDSPPSGKKITFLDSWARFWVQLN